MKPRTTWEYARTIGERLLGASDRSQRGDATCLRFSFAMVNSKIRVAEGTKVHVL
jgi:hypothetical protein